MKLSERFARTTEFGDNQSQLLDYFERVSFEVHLNQAILLGRSLSEPGRSQPHAPQLPAAVQVVHVGVPRCSGRSSRFRRVLKKLLGPVLRRKGGGADSNSSRKVGAEMCVPKCSYSKAFSRSLRV